MKYRNVGLWVYIYLKGRVFTDFLLSLEKAGSGEKYV